MNYGRHSSLLKLALVASSLIMLLFTFHPSAAATDDEPLSASARPIAPLATQAKAVARMWVFYSESCPSCQIIVNQFLPTLANKYGSQLEITLIEVSEPRNLQLLMALEKAYGVPAERSRVPEIFIGNDVFLGAEAILKDLQTTIDNYLAQGGVDLTPPMKQLLSATRQSSEDATVHAVLFHMPTCGHCEAVKQNVLPVLKQKYGERFRLKLIDVTEDEPWDKFESVAKSLLPEPGPIGVPALVISNTIIIGANQIAERADLLIQRALFMGGTDWPVLPEGLDGPEYELPASATPSSPPTATPLPSPANAGELPLIHLAYFHQPGCQECDRVKVILDALARRYPQLQVTLFDATQNAALNEWLGEKAGVPEQKRLTAPAIYIGQDALLGEEINTSSLEALLAKYTSTGAAKTWESFASDQASANIVQRFLSLGTLTVLGAGLVDGLNPCAFATLIFFISYLTLSGRRGRAVLFVGLAFTLGVFIAYLAVGLGLSKALTAFGALARIGRWVYAFTAILCLALGVLSLLDFLKARQGRAEEMALSLPRVLRARINAVIRWAQQSNAFVPVAFLTGAVVSLIELACTGQVYLPTIIFVLSVPELRLRAFLYLLLYNLFFVFPLIVVFVLAYFGTTAAQFTRFLRTNAPTIKLATSLLFLALAAWLIIALF